MKENRGETSSLCVINEEEACFSVVNHYDLLTDESIPLGTSDMEAF